MYMEKYDPAFGSVARAIGILVADLNFGYGSSREQAVTAMMARQIPLVIAGSFGSIFDRNCINNAVMGVKVPRLVQHLRGAFKSGENILTRHASWTSV